MVGSPSRMRLALAVVPPMSNEMALPQPSAPPTWADAMMPPTGPDSIIVAGCSVASSGVITPPLERMIDSVHQSRSRRGSSLGISRSRRPWDIGIHHRGRHPLELAILAQDLVRQRQIGIWHRVADHLACDPLVSGIGVGMEETDRHSFNSLRSQCRAGRRDRGGVERRVHLPGAREAVRRSRG